MSRSMADDGPALLLPSGHVPQESIDARNVAIGSDALLRAIWREHRDIMRGWERGGKWVVRPSKERGK